MAAAIHTISGIAKGKIIEHLKHIGVDRIIIGAHDDKDPARSFNALVETFDHPQICLIWEIAEPWVPEFSNDAFCAAFGVIIGYDHFKVPKSLVPDESKRFSQKFRPPESAHAKACPRYITWGIRHIMLDKITQLTKLILVWTHPPKT
jgi:hypothetical protein